MEIYQSRLRYEKRLLIIHESKDVVNRSIMALFLPFLTIISKKKDEVIISNAVFEFSNI